MHRILVPVDGSPSADRAVQHVISLKRAGMDVEVQLLHVQPAQNMDDFPPMAQPGLAERLEHDEAEHTFAPAGKLLGEAAMRYSEHLASGDPAQEIARYADIHGCTDVVMGTHGRGTVKSLLLGSVATKVVHLVKIPVTLVK